MFFEIPLTFFRIIEVEGSSTGETPKIVVDKAVPTLQVGSRFDTVWKRQQGGLLRKFSRRLRGQAFIEDPATAAIRSTISAGNHFFISPRHVLVDEYGRT
jgi:hypothetical protein